MQVLTTNEMELVSGGNAFVKSGAYYVGSEVGAAFLEGAELGAIAGPGGAIIGGLAALGVAALWKPRTDSCDWMAAEAPPSLAREHGH